MSKNSQKSKGVTPRRSTKVTVPIASGVIHRSSPPVVRGNGSGIQVSHREYSGSVTNLTTLGFALTSISTAGNGYDINPLCTNLFPWLSSVAGNYDKFQFVKLAITLIGSNPTTTPGRVYAAVDYDWDDPVPTLKSAMMNNLSAVESPIWNERLVLNVDCPRMNKDMPWRFVSPFKKTIGEPRTQFGGYVMFAMDTSVSNCTFDLVVEYTVKLDIPAVDLPSYIVSSSSVSDFSPLVWASATVIPIKYAATSVVPTLVTPGAGDVPLLKYGTTTFPNAIDLRNNHWDTVEVAMDYFASTTPSAFYGTGGPYGKASVFDQEGNLIRDIDPFTDPDNKFSRTMSGAATATGWGTTGATCRTLLTIVLSGLLGSIPTASFLTFWLRDSVARTGVNGGYGLRLIS